MDSVVANTRLLYGALMRPHSAYAIADVKYAARVIMERVQNGEVTWRTLGFSRKDVECRLRRARLRFCKQLMGDITSQKFTFTETRNLLTRLNEERVGDGEALSWDDILDDPRTLERCLRTVALRESERDYRFILKSHDAYAAERAYDRIRGVLHDGLVTWESLPFSELDLYRARAGARARSANDVFRLLSSNVLPPDVRSLRAEQLRQKISRVGYVREDHLVFSPDTLARLAQ